mmetsp:Transcript_4648/g.11260  ORF Transcript_4648/g.11260 Transcript_4648/m.11260 type:complete len:333 (-) Transcript_4648:1785-2783(-)
MRILRHNADDLTVQGLLRQVHCQPCILLWDIAPIEVFDVPGKLLLQARLKVALVLLPSRHLTYSSQLIRGVIIQMQPVRKAAGQAFIGSHQPVHLVLVACQHHQQVCAIVLHLGEECPHCLLREGVAMSTNPCIGVYQRIGFVEEKTPTHGLLNGSLHSRGRATHELCLQLQAVLLDKTIPSQDPVGMKELRQNPSEGCLAGPWIARDDDVKTDSQITACASLLNKGHFLAHLRKPILRFLHANQIPHLLINGSFLLLTFTQRRVNLEVCSRQCFTLWTLSWVIPLLNSIEEPRDAVLNSPLKQLLGYYQIASLTQILALHATTVHLLDVQD